MALPILLALALSVDGLVAGAAYGMRGISVPKRSLAVIALCTALCLGGAMLAGGVVRELVSEGAMRRLGACILGAIGFWQLLHGSLEYLRQQATGKPRGVFKVRVRDLGIVVQILREPVLADTDSSGRIDPKEAFLLGTALGLDAFGAGLAAALLQLSAAALVPAVAGAQVVGTVAGLYLGRRYGERVAGGRGLLLPGALLCLLALFQLR